MIVLNSAKMIYIHIQKTGGTSVEISISRAAKWNDLILGGNRSAETLSKHYRDTFGVHKHSNAQKVRAMVGEDVWRDYFTWATVRNPYGRLASLYGYIARMSEPRLADIGFPAQAPHGRQVAWVDSSEYPANRHWGFVATKAYLKSRGARRPFSEFLRAPELLEHQTGLTLQSRYIFNRQGEQSVDRIIKLEQLSQQWPGLMQEIGLGALPLEFRNETKPPWKKTVGELFTIRGDIDFINERLKEDFRRLGYDMM
jgi:hypothetical protein